MVDHGFELGLVVSNKLVVEDSSLIANFLRDASVQIVGSIRFSRRRRIGNDFDSGVIYAHGSDVVDGISERERQFDCGGSDSISQTDVTRTRDNVIGAHLDDGLDVRDVLGASDQVFGLLSKGKQNKGSEIVVFSSVSIENGRRNVEGDATNDRKWSVYAMNDSIEGVGGSIAVASTLQSVLSGMFDSGRDLTSVVVIGGLFFLGSTEVGSGGCGGSVLQTRLEAGARWSGHLKNKC